MKHLDRSNLNKKNLLIIQYFMRFKKKLFNITTHPFIINVARFRFSLEAFSILHCFILTNFILKHTKWSNKKFEI